MRKPTFLAKKVWKTVPWSARGRRKDIMELLLEHVVDLPAVLWRFDQYNLALKADSTAVNDLKIMSSKLWIRVSELEDRLRRWKRECADTYPSGQPYEVQDQGPGTFPTLQYLDSVTQRVIRPSTLVYPDPQLARTLCMYYASMLLLATVDTRPEIAITSAEKLEMARSICRSMEYYIRAVPGNMINRMAFPLRVAYDSLPPTSLEKKFIEGVFQLVERKNALRSWGKYIPDISSKKG